MQLDIYCGCSTLFLPFINTLATIYNMYFTKKKLMYGVHTHHSIICTRHSTYVFSAPLLHCYLTLCNVATHARAHTLRSIRNIHDVMEYMHVSSICFQLASKQPWQLLPISVCMYVYVYGLFYVCVINKKNYCMTWLLLLNL